MQVDLHLQNPQPKVWEFNFETASCFQIKKTLDDLFSGRKQLEKTDARIKRFVFAHLETCTDCCRSFDARVRFHVPKSNIIY